MKKSPLKPKSSLKPGSSLKRTPNSLPQKWYKRKTRSGITKKRLSPYWKQVHRTDALFSVLRRLQEADVNGQVVCFTCGYKGPWKFGKLELGHYSSRGNMSLRWEPLNGHVQCEYCNRVLKGNLEIYRLNLIKEYGVKTIENLEALSSELRKWTLQEMKELRTKFTKLIKEIKKQKGL